ncbi:TolC family outer membrane protein [Pseudogemmobacter sonorensis]|uniref:TolC family outer membrane protein n=1 Tax=Pseudogemmobacter sonorensis TaxID=2989681 RepID=UPI0036859EB4
MLKLFRAMALGVAVAAAALPARAETLADALIAAYRNSNLLEQNQAVLRAADEDFAVAVSALRPVIGYVANLGATWTDSRVSGVRVNTEDLSASVTLSADLVLFDFGRRQFSIDIAKESVLATRQALILVEQQVLLAAVQAYVDVRLTQEIVALRQNNVRLITQELRAAQDRFEVGEITRTDVSIAEASLAGAQAQLAAAEGNLRVAREAYKAATGNYPGNLAALPASPRLGRTLDEARAVALATHPSIKQAQHSVAIAEKQVALADAAMKPSIGLGASISAADTNDTVRSTLGLSMNQTLYAGGRLSALYRQSITGKERALAALRQTAVEVDQNIGTLWATLAIYVASIEASDRQIVAAQAAFEGVREEANLGARTTLDVLDAEQDLLDARAARLEAEANRYVAVYRILGAMGLLTADHLKLGIPTYDPEAYFNAVKNAPATTSRGKKLDGILEKYGK